MKHCVPKTPVLLGVGSNGKNKIKLIFQMFHACHAVAALRSTDCAPDQEYRRWGPGYLHVRRSHLHQLINTYTLTHGRWGEVPYRAETPGALKTHAGGTRPLSLLLRAEGWSLAPAPSVLHANSRRNVCVSVAINKACRQRERGTVRCGKLSQIDFSLFWPAHEIMHILTLA